MKATYIFFTLGMGTIITVLVSLACSYWFFFSLMGGEGYQAIGAGIAGCAIQLFGYGFAGSFLPINRFTRYFLCTIPLALSMICSYSALYGYLSKEQESQTLTSTKQALIVDLLEQSLKDKEIASSAAKQGVSEAFRSQAKSFLQFNDASREKDVELLEKLEQSETQTRKANPLDGLVKVTGDNHLTTVAFCGWLAVMFDILPVIAIGVISRRKESEKPADVVVEDITVIVANQAQSEPNSVIEKESTLQTKTVEQTHHTAASQYSVPPAQIETTEGQVEDETLGDAALNETPEGSEDLNEVLGEEIAQRIKQGTLEPNYKAVQAETGWSQWKAQEFFKHCQEIGLLEKEGRTFKVVNRLAVVSDIKKVANA